MKLAQTDRSFRSGVYSSLFISGSVIFRYFSEARFYVFYRMSARQVNPFRSCRVVRKTQHWWHLLITTSGLPHTKHEMPFGGREFAAKNFETSPRLCLAAFLWQFDSLCPRKSQKGQRVRGFSWKLNWKSFVI